MHYPPALRFIAVTIVGAHLSLHGQTQLPETVVTATPTERVASTVPASVTVITRMEIEESSAVDLPDLLRSVGGLEVVDVTGSGGRTTTVDMRGFGETAAANLAVVVDGRTLNSPTLAGTDFTTIPLARIERIEIMRGAGAVIYGDNAAAGVINIVTRRPSGDDGTELSLETRAAEYATWRTSAAATGSQDDLAWRADAGWNDFDGWRDNSEVTYRSLAAGFTWVPSEQFSLALDGGWKEDEYGLPGAVAPGADPRSTNTPGNKAASEDAYLSIAPEILLSDWTIKTPLHFRQVDSDADFSGFPVESRIRQLDFRPSVSRKITVGDATHNLSLGIDYRRSKLDEAVNSTPATREESAVWFYDSIALLDDRLFLDFGARAATIDYDYETLQDSEHDLIAFSGGITYRYTEGSRVFASVQRGYRSQLLDELNFVFNPGTGGFDPAHPALQPQQSLTTQAGIFHQFSDALGLGVTAFMIHTDNEIFYDPATFANSSYEETVRRGLEFELKSKPAESFSASAYLTLLDSEMRDGAYNGNRIPGTTPVSARLQARWQPLEQLWFDARVRWIHDRALISDWVEAEPDWNDSFVVTDVTASWRPISWLTLYCGCNNLFDEEYAEYGIATAGADFTRGTPDDEARIYPSPERELFGGARVTLTF